MRIADSDIEVIVFDLFGVLISFEDDIVTARLAPHCDDPDEAFGRLQKLTASHNIMTGASTLSELHRMVVDTEGLTLSYSDFRAAWMEPCHEAVPGMAELVSALSEHYRLVLLSNVDRDYWQVVRSLHRELDCFEALLVSCDLGMAKPDPEIFRHACRVTSTEPSQCFFVDDTALNVDAAQKLGFYGHTFRTVSGLGTVLRQADTKGIQMFFAP